MTDDLPAAHKGHDHTSTYESMMGWLKSLGTAVNGFMAIKMEPTWKHAHKGRDYLIRDLLSC